MDYEEDFKKTCREVAQLCTARGKALHAFQAPGGEPEHGWYLEETTRVNERGNPGSQGWWETCTITNTIFLREDGVVRSLYREVYEGPDHGGYADGGHDVRGAPGLVGISKGKPFSDWKSKVERLPYV